MSYYSLKFTVPKNTAENSPYEEKIQVTGGILHQVLVSIPPGHKGVTGCAIDEGLHQIAPSNQNQWFTGNNITFSYPEYHELPRDTRELVIRGYNTSTLYDHIFIIGIGIMPKAIYDAIVGLREDMQPMIADMASLAKFFAAPELPPEGS